MSARESQVLKTLQQTSRFLDGEKLCLDFEGGGEKESSSACQQLAVAANLQAKVDVLKRIKVCCLLVLETSVCSSVLGSTAHMGNLSKHYACNYLSYLKRI
jgi:hypothetical protein